MKTLRRLIICITLGVLFSIVHSPKMVDAKNITIVIDPGHGGPKDNDADKGASYYGLVEKDINLKTAIALYNELTKYKNVNVYMTRADDREVALKDRVNIAKSVNADVMVCVHYNASGDHLLYGGEAFVPSKGQGYVIGYSLANSVMNQWKAVGSVDKGIKTRIGKQGDYYGVIRFGAEVNLPVVILEHGYMDNYHDFNNLNDENDYIRFGQLDAKGIADYYGLSKTDINAMPQPKNIVKAPTGVVRNDTTGPLASKMTVDSYNPLTGEVKYTIYGTDPESRVLFSGTGISTRLDGAGKIVPVLMDLQLFTGKGKSTGVTYVPVNYEGPLYGILYNNYNETSNTVVATISK